MENAATNVFVSYSRSDSEFVLKVARALRMEGRSIWVDQLDIPKGARWDDEVEKALKYCSCLLVVLSPTSSISPNVLDEVSYALNEKKTVVPILFRNCDVPFRLQRLQYIDFTTDFDEAYRQLSLALDSQASPANEPQVRPKAGSPPPTGGARAAPNSAGLGGSPHFIKGLIGAAIVAGFVGVAVELSNRGSTERQPSAPVDDRSRLPAPGESPAQPSQLPAVGGAPGQIDAAQLPAVQGSPAQLGQVIKVGILYSLSGTMALSETVLKDVARMTIDEINARGGVMGKTIEPVVVDPASNWPLFAAKARQMISQDKVAVIFGCGTGVSRKSVLPVLEELNGLLFYSLPSEGEEISNNVFYTGSVPNQQAIPAVEYLMSEEGGGAKRFVLLGTDYVYPRTTNKILRAFLKSKGVADRDIDEKYTPFGYSDYQTIVADVKKFAAGGKTAVVSTINGDSNVPFYNELGNQGLKATDVPVVTFSVGEEELRGVDTRPLVGHLAAWNYFMSLKNPTNDAFKAKWAAYARAKKLPGADKPLTNDPMEATYIGIHMWAQAVEKAGSTDTDKVIAAMAGQTFPAPGGFTLTMDARNHHLHKPVFIGEVKGDGQFNVVWKTKAPIAARPWSPYIEGNDKKKGEPEKK